MKKLDHRVARYATQVGSDPKPDRRLSQTLGSWSCGDFRSRLDRSGLGRSYLNRRAFDHFHRATTGIAARGAAIADGLAASRGGLANRSGFATAVRGGGSMATVGPQTREQTAMAAMTTKQTMTATATIRSRTATIRNRTAAVRNRATATGNGATAIRGAVATQITEQAAVAAMLAEQATASAVASPSRTGRVLIPDHGDRQNREEYGDSTKDRAIHLKFLQKLTTSTCRRNLTHSTRFRRRNKSEET